MVSFEWNGQGGCGDKLLTENVSQTDCAIEGDVSWFWLGAVVVLASALFKRR